MNLISWQRSSPALWPALGRLSDLRDEFDRWFEAPLTDLARGSQLFSNWTPALDVYEDKDNFVVKAELPGMKEEDINVSLHNGSLSISGERASQTKHEEAEVYRAERFFGRFQRTVTLPATVAADKIKAQYKDGVLAVTLPKAEEAKPKQIDVAVLTTRSGGFTRQGSPHNETTMKTTTQPKMTTTVERQTEARFVAPEVNICETRDGYILEAEMSGVSKDGLEITIEGNEITITGHRNNEAPAGEPLFRELSAVDFRRVFELDPAIDTGKISAKMLQGVLTLILPKSEQVKFRKIAVND